MSLEHGLPLRTATLAVRDYTDTNDLAELLELTREPLFVDTPA